MKLRDKKICLEEGSIMVLLILICISIVIVSAFAIDITRLGASHSELKRESELLALGGFSAYTNYKPEDGMSDYEKKVNRLKEVKKKVKNLAKKSNLIGLAKKSFFGADDVVKIRYLDSEDFEDSNVKIEVLPGKWWFKEPIDGCSSFPASESVNSCPCNGEKFNGPCFSHNKSTDDTINSLRVSVKASGDTSIMSFFSSIFGIRKNQISTYSTVAFMPRRALIAIDLSSSVTNETHYKRMSPTDESINPKFAPIPQYSYRLNGPKARTFNPGDKPELLPKLCKSRGGTKTCTCSSSGVSALALCPDNSCLFGDPRYNINSENEMLTPDLIRYNGFYKFGKWYREPLPKNRGSDDSITNHYRDGYRCYVFKSEYEEGIGDPNEDYPAEAIGTPGNYKHEGHYLVETNYVNSGSSSFYRGPEPLSSILSGSMTVLEAFSKRAVAGDLIGLVGFGRAANIKKRNLALSPPIDSNTTFKLMKEIMYGPGIPPMEVREKRISNGFFPLYKSKTNIPLALIRSYKMFSKADLDDIADNFVILFTDGITNCQQKDGERDLAVPSKYYCVPALPMSYILSLEWIQDIVNQLYIPNSIAIHTFLIGDYVRPHTLLEPSSSGEGCKNEAEFREEGKRYVDDFFDNKVVDNTLPLPFSCAGCPKSGTSWYYVASSLYPNYGPGLSYAPPAGSGELSTAENFRNIYNNPTPEKPFVSANYLYKFSEQTGGYWLPIRKSCKKGEDVSSEITNGCKLAGSDPSYDYSDLKTKGYVDDYNRLMCDPMGKDTEAQIVEGMNKIMSDVPFTLVE